MIEFVRCIGAGSKANVSVGSTYAREGNLIFDEGCVVTEEDIKQCFEAISNFDVTSAMIDNYRGRGDYPTSAKKNKLLSTISDCVDIVREISKKIQPILVIDEELFNKLESESEIEYVSDQTYTSQTKKDILLAATNISNLENTVALLEHNVDNKEQAEFRKPQEFNIVNPGIQGSLQILSPNIDRLHDRVLALQKTLKPFLEPTSHAKYDYPDVEFRSIITLIVESQVSHLEEVKHLLKQIKEALNGFGI